MKAPPQISPVSREVELERVTKLNAELLAALKIARDGFYVAGDNYAEAFNQIEAAIAKAEGRG